MKKIKVLSLGDDIRLPSGVGTQCRYVTDALLKSGKFQIFHLAGAIKHQSYQPVKTQEYGDDLVIYPVDGFGTQQLVREMIRHHKIDIIWITTDPRFYGWLWEIENEIRALCPIVYWMIWDNYPYPWFNKRYYESNDVLACITKLTYDIAQKVVPDTDCVYLPHAVDPSIFKRLPDAEVKKFKDTSFNGTLKDKFVFFWNNRNARRKHSTTLVWWFADFLEKYDLKDKVMLLMHTDPIDPHGTDLPEILEHRGIVNGEVIISAAKLPADQMNILYNMADCTLNIGDAEGHGVCLTTGNHSLILGRGSVDIKDIQVGDYVYSMDGKYHRVNNVSSRLSDRVVSIKSYGNLLHRCTPNHPFLVQKPKYPYSSRTRYFKNHVLFESVENQKLEWTRADELKVGDYLVVPYAKDERELPQNLDLLNYVKELNVEYNDEHIWLKNNRNFKDRKVKRFIPLNEDVLKLFGWYLAEGCCDTGRSMIFDLHAKEVPIAEELLRTLENNFGVHGKVLHEGNSKVKENRSRLRVTNRILGTFAKNFFGSGCRNKYINEFLMKTPTALMPLVGGLFGGDGYNTINQYRLRNTSWHLISQVKTILSSVKIYSSISDTINKGFANNRIFTISIGHKFLDKFCSLTGLPREYSGKVQAPQQKKPLENRIVVAENCFLVPIRKISIEDKQEQVYDIEVPDCRCFVSNEVVVHNSTHESLSAETPIIAVKTGGLQFQVSDGEKEFGIGIEPCSKMLVGSPEVPAIIEDRISQKDFEEALLKMVNMPEEERKFLGKLGKQHIEKNFNFDEMGKKWIELLTHMHEKYGSWETRKLHDSWKFQEVGI